MSLASSEAFTTAGPRSVIFSRKRLSDHLKVADRVLAVQLEVDCEMSRRLSLVGIGMQRHGEERLEIFNREGFVILDLDAFCAKARNGNDACAEHLAAPRLFRAALAHLEQAGVDRLPLQRVIDLLRPLALEDDTGDAGYAVPHGKVGDGRAAGQSKNVIALEDVSAMAAVNLLDEDARIAVVDVDGDVHFVER